MDIQNVVWDKSNSSGVTLSEGDLRAVFSGWYTNKVRASLGRSSGKYYFEMKVTSGTAPLFGIAGSNVPMNDNSIPGDSKDIRGYYPYAPHKYPEKTIYGTTGITGQVVSVLLDLDNNTLEFWKNGVSQGVSHTNLSTIPKPVFPFISSGNAGSNDITVNFGATSFSYLPSNLPEGTYSYDGSKNLTPYNKILLLSGEKTYSLKSEEIKHETKMTSNILPAPYVASASSQYSTTLIPFRAFNGINTDANSWATINNTKTGWIQIDYGLGNEKLANVVYITNRNNTADFATSAPKDFNILGSNDGIKFDKIAEIKNQTNWIQNETRKFRIIAPKHYRYYRLEILSNNGATYTAIGEILYALEQGLSEIPNASEENFINHGADSVDNAGVIFVNKNYILQDTVSENSDGLWVQEIDRKPLSIKFE